MNLGNEGNFCSRVNDGSQTICRQDQDMEGNPQFRKLVTCLMTCPQVGLFIAQVSQHAHKI